METSAGPIGGGGPAGSWPPQSSSGGGHQQSQPGQPDNVAPIIFTQSQIEACLLRGLSKWEIVAELQTTQQLRQNIILDVWARLEAQNQNFFSSYEQFIRLRNQVQDFNDLVLKLFEDQNALAAGGAMMAMGGKDANGAGVPPPPPPQQDMGQYNVYANPGSGAPPPPPAGNQTPPPPPPPPHMFAVPPPPPASTSSGSGAGPSSTKEDISYPTAELYESFPRSRKEVESAGVALS